jgi:hypothetical protein
MRTITDEPFAVGDVVETIKGAKFWGEVVSVYRVPKLFSGTDWRCDVYATDPGFEGTLHVYPATQLALRNPPSGEAGEVAWPGRKFCEVAERNVTELAKWVKGKDDKEVASDAGLALRTLLAHTALPTIKEPTDGG